MAYATPTDMVRRFGQQEMIRLTTPAGEDMESVVVANLDAALADASAIMDGYLRRQYATPLSPAPAEANRICCDIARYDLSTGDGKTVGEEVKARHEAAIRWLRDVADGKVKLDVAVHATGEESFAMVRERDATAAPFGVGGFL